MPASQAASTACAIGSSATGPDGLPPMEMLRTRIPYSSLWAMAHAMPAITVEARPWPKPSSTLIATTSASGATPRNCVVANPPSSIGSDARPSPAMRPATKVPWPASSYGCFLPLTRSSQPVIRDSGRSVLTPTPLSRIATVTPSPLGPPASGATRSPRPTVRRVTSIEAAPMPYTGLSATIASTKSSPASASIWSALSQAPTAPTNDSLVVATPAGRRSQTFPRWPGARTSTGTASSAPAASSATSTPGFTLSPRAAAEAGATASSMRTVSSDRVSRVLIVLASVSVLSARQGPATGRAGVRALTAAARRDEAGGTGRPWSARECTAGGPVRQPSYLGHPRPLALRPCLAAGLPFRTVRLSAARAGRMRTHRRIVNEGVARSGDTGPDGQNREAVGRRIFGRASSRSVLVNG